MAKTAAKLCSPHSLNLFCLTADDHDICGPARASFISACVFVNTEKSCFLLVCLFC